MKITRTSRTFRAALFTSAAACLFVGGNAYAQDQGTQASETPPPPSTITRLDRDEMPAVTAHATST